jgi:uncharacterized membrane protein
MAGGLFVIYFGNSKSRIKGALVFVIGVVSLLVFLWLTWGVNVIPVEPPQVWTPELVVGGVFAVLGAVAGVIIGFLLVLLSILKR